MPRFDTHHTVPYSPEQMFAVVADVEKYPQFVPHCSALRVLSRQRLDESREIITAEMTVRYMSAKEKYISRVSFDKKMLTVDVELVSGPFKHLSNKWKFEAAGQSTLVHFHIDYAFRSRLFALMAGAVFGKLFERFGQSFEDRAAELYEAQ